MSRIFSLVLLFSFLFTPISFAKDGNIYSIKDIPVSVEGETPAMARNIAINTAQRDALLILLNHLEIDVIFSDQISDEELSDMVRSRHLSDEKISGNNYSASFDITFGKDFVKHTLKQKNITKSGIEAKKPDTYLLIPIKVSGEKSLLWEENNDWRSAIAAQLLENSQDKLILPDNDIENISAINRSNIFDASYSDFEPMLLRYQAKGAYLLFLSSDLSAGGAKVRITYIAKMQNKHIKLKFVNVENVQYDSLISIISKKTVEYVANLKTGSLSQMGNKELAFKVKINSLGNWLTMKNRIENSGLINQLNIKSISRDHVVIKVNYTGSNSNIIKAFADRGINLHQTAANLYTTKAH